MNPVIEKVVHALRERLGDAVAEVREFRDDVFVVVDRTAIVEAATWLRDNDACPFPLCEDVFGIDAYTRCLLYTSPSPRDRTRSRMPSSA